MDSSSALWCGLLPFLPQECKPDQLDNLWGCLLKIKNVKMATAEYQTKNGSFLSPGLTTRLQTHEASAKETLLPSSFAKFLVNELWVMGEMCATLAQWRACTFLPSKYTRSSCVESVEPPDWSSHRPEEGYSKESPGSRKTFLSVKTLRYWRCLLLQHGLSLSLLIHRRGQK